ncbi:hypothetical protein ACQ4PT_060447 [Festuca glaucescens]
MSSRQRSVLTAQRCTVAAIQSCVKWEPESFPLVEPLLGKPAVPLGFVPPPPDGAHRAAGMNREHAAARLGVVRRAGERGAAAREPGARAGSQAGARRDTLSMGSQKTQWRRPCHHRRRLAPSQFPGTHQRPRAVTTGWVPQVSVLAHGALGEFLTHCSRNSLMDGLLFGHPLVMLPIFGDQGPNTRQMEAKKVRLQVARDEEDGSFGRHGVASAVRAVGEARRGFVAGHVSEEKKTSN